MRKAYAWIKCALNKIGLNGAIEADEAIAYECCRRTSNNGVDDLAWNVTTVPMFIAYVCGAYRVQNVQTDCNVLVGGFALRAFDDTARKCNIWKQWIISFNYVLLGVCVCFACRCYFNCGCIISLRHHVTTVFNLWNLCEAPLQRSVTTDASYILCMTQAYSIGCCQADQWTIVLTPSSIGSMREFSNQYGRSSASSVFRL